MREMFQTPGYKPYLEALRALQAARVRDLLKGGLSERKIGSVEGALETLNILGHMPDEINHQLHTAQEEQESKDETNRQNTVHEISLTGRSRRRG
jgi:hypothetical protein